MGFFEGGLLPLVDSVLTHNRPLYVQYYVTARCNLRCQQCNVIYANADQEECNIEQVRKIAKNLADIGTSMVLLTGGEPFMRRDLPEIAEAFIQNGVHPRLQTNGFASEEQLAQLVEVGCNDISISLDSLDGARQDETNGGFEGSWERALRTISFINQTFPADSFCSLGCVLAPSNIEHIPSVIEFATEIGWWVSLVPAHQSAPTSPRSFASYDPAMTFGPKEQRLARELVGNVRDMKARGFNLYDSEEYLADIERYIAGEPIRWRRRNKGICDSPNLYFAIQPNGDMAVCCDFRLETRVPTFHDSFVEAYQNRTMFKEARSIAAQCSGCMYGSFPEITISSRFLRPMLDRARLFATDGFHRALKPMTFEEMASLARRIDEKRVNGLR